MLITLTQLQSCTSLINIRSYIGLNVQGIVSLNGWTGLQQHHSLQNFVTMLMLYFVNSMFNELHT